MDDFRNLRQGAFPDFPEQEATDVALPEELEIDHSKDLITVEFPDGSVSINLAPLTQGGGDSSKHGENLALHVDAGALAQVADELLRLIEEDLRKQDQRLKDIEKGIDLLGIKLEEPRTEPNDEGMSVVKHPLLLEAILRFQANARGELLPVDGPVKVRNDGSNTRLMDSIANALEQDFNHYLTVGAPEFYPDTDRMFFSLGHGGEAYKKVYQHPLKRRPVSETIDRKDLILSDGAVSLETCKRITHRSRMSQSTIKRMQMVGAWRDAPNLSLMTLDFNPVEQKLADISGVDLSTSLDPKQNDPEIYECYCELDLPGFENKDGLPLPYRVTINKESRDVYEIRRWWDEDDETFTRKEAFVEYVFVPAFDGLNLGLLHILGNANRALTAAWRIALDNGMYANFPGGVMARGTGKQQTTNIRVAPGQVAPIDADGVPLKDAFLPLPYRDVTAGFLGVINNIEQTSQRVGGTAETATGEGRSDAPVGTTIAMIEQATKVLNAVHKRMHSAQQKEFKLLKELFKQDPEALWRCNNAPQLDKQKVVAALNDADIVPVADPNTSSQTLRIQKAIAIKTLAAQSPQLYDMAAVDRRVLEMVGIEDIDELFTKVPPQMPGPDPAKIVDSQAKMITAQSKAAETQAKIQAGHFEQQGDNPAELEVKAIDAKTRAADSQADNLNRAADRDAKLRMEQMKLERERLIHSQDRETQGREHQHDMLMEAAKQQHPIGQAEADRKHEQQMQKLQKANKPSGGSKKEG